MNKSRKQSVRLPDEFLEAVAEVALEVDETVTTYLGESVLCRLAQSRLTGDQMERARRALDARLLRARRGPRGSLPVRERNRIEEREDQEP